MKVVFSKKYISVVGVILVGIVVGLVIQFAKAGWRGPTSLAPSDNISAPINTSSQSQLKQGTLMLSALKLYKYNFNSIAGGQQTPRCSCDKNDSTRECGQSGSDYSTVSSCWDWYVSGGNNFSSKYVRDDSRVELNYDDGLTVVNTNIGVNGITFHDGSVQNTAVSSVNDSLCISTSLMPNNECKPGFYLKSTTKCCPFNSSIAALAGTWYKIDQLSTLHWSSTWGWQPIQSKLFTTQKVITAMRITGDMDDGGYCYAHWGSGYFLAPAQSEQTAAAGCNLNSDGKEYPSYRVVNSSSDCTSGEYFSQKCQDGGADVGYVCDPAYCVTPMPAWNVDNDGNISICQGGYGTLMISSTKTGLNIPAGTVVNLKAQHINGPGSGHDHCELEVQYGN